MDVWISYAVKNIIINNALITYDNNDILLIVFDWQMYMYTYVIGKQNNAQTS